MAESLWTDGFKFGSSPETGREYMDVSENSGIPKSSILIGYSFINHPFWGTPIFGNIHIKSWPWPTCCQRCCCCGWDIDLMLWKVEAAQRVRDLWTSSCAVTGWWLRFQPIWKIWVKMGSSSRKFGVKIQKICETTTGQVIILLFVGYFCWIRDEILPMLYMGTIIKPACKDLYSPTCTMECPPGGFCCHCVSLIFLDPNISDQATNFSSSNELGRRNRHWFFTMVSTLR